MPLGVGQFDSLTASGGTLTVWGWAYDPDSPAGIYLWVTLDGVGHHVWSSVLRDDVRRYYPAARNPGYVDRLTASRGAHSVCVTAANSGPGQHTFLGCRTVTVT